MDCTVDADGMPQHVQQLMIGSGQRLIINEAAGDGDQPPATGPAHAIQLQLL